MNFIVIGDIHLQWPQGAVDEIKTTVLEQGALLMSAMDDLNAAVAEAVAAMTHAATTIENHVNVDPQLQAVASSLHDAAAALSGVDMDAPVPAP